MKFTEPRFEFIPGSERIRHIEDWIFELEFGLQIIIPRGFETDLASIPRLFRNIMSPWGNLRLGAIPHDFFYQHGYLLSPMSSGAVFNLRSRQEYHRFADRFGSNCPVYIDQSREWADKLLRHITEHTAPDAKIQTATAYRLLRMFGWPVWNRYREYGPGAYNSNSLGYPGMRSGVLI